MESRVVLLLMALICTLKRRAGSDCVFPGEWHGSWSVGQRTIEIGPTTISQNGMCVNREGNKFLLLNKSLSNGKCFKCMVFTLWHHNLLQYKESHCWHHESISDVCSLINGDKPLKTAVRVHSTPEPCPFQGAYTFSYANGTVGVLHCDNPISEIRACSDETRFRFLFKQCPNVPGTYNQELDFECLATWENGEKFLYGKFTTGEKTEDTGSYRCLMYSLYGSRGEMSMSIDPTCQGLQSPSLGIITIKLSKDMSSLPRGSCKFSDFLFRHQKWRDLEGRFLFQLDDGLQMMSIKERKNSDDRFGISVTKLVLRCVERIRQNVIYSHVINSGEFIVHSTNNTCNSFHQCIRVNERVQDVVELIFGDVLEERKFACSFKETMKYILIPEVNTPSLCPLHLQGKYHYTDKASERTGEINLGCREDHEMVIETIGPAGTKSVNILECFQQWREDSATFLVAKYPGISGDSIQCLIFESTEFGVEMQGDILCEGNRRIINNKHINFLLHTPPETCYENIVMQSDQNPRPSIHNTHDSNRMNVIDYPSRGTVVSLNFILLSVLFTFALRWHR
ncbi:hypothetical protein CHS0354_010833 [Potamilus streckersoni]|uniref:Uncharacterized protein n=1 Tax=Potamilus streckersoni TaxID=2493646 RepID=A0AAE0T9F3_9BIVA|nr:hypothetical protein CHS0354_010833 [Potamilus streckersoni]